MRLFKNKERTINQTLDVLASAYENYIKHEWDKACDAGPGEHILALCFKDSEYLKYVIQLIGKTLFDDNNSIETEKAETVCLLFQHLYESGFKDGIDKERLRKCFEGIFPQESLDKLNADEALINDCFVAYYIYENCKQQYAPILR